MDSATILEIMNQLLRFLAKIAWPIVTLIFILKFKCDIKEIFKRLKYAKIFGNEIELEVIKFKETVEEAREEVCRNASIIAEVDEKQFYQQDQDENEILEAAKINPKIGIMKLSATLEKEVRILAGSLGQLKPKIKNSAFHLCNSLIEKNYLPLSATKSLKIFWDIRNKIVHGHVLKDDENIPPILDIGLALLRTIKSIPHQINIVCISGIDIYSDSLCINLIKDAKGLILKMIDSSGATIAKRIFPTTNPNHYKFGEKVTWEWNPSKRWAMTWYINPDNNEKTKAWDNSEEFIGRNIEDV